MFHRVDFYSRLPPPMNLKVPDEVLHVLITSCHGHDLDKLYQCLSIVDELTNAAMMKQPTEWPSIEKNLHYPLLLPSFWRCPFDEHSEIKISELAREKLIKGVENLDGQSFNCAKDLSLCYLPALYMFYRGKIVRNDHLFAQLPIQGI